MSFLDVVSHLLLIALIFVVYVRYVYTPLCLGAEQCRV